MNYDYIGHDYRYLDDAFHIAIDAQTFYSLLQAMVETYNFNPDYISEYKDSVIGSVFGEFESAENDLLPV